MASKTITVVDASGNERRKKLSTQDGYKNLLFGLKVAVLKDADDIEIEDFESLEDGGTYTLGQPRQQQDGEFCCSFCLALCCAILYASFVVRMRIAFNGHNRA